MAGMTSKATFGFLVLLTFGNLFGQREVIAPEGASSTLPFSPGIRSGDFLYLSGAIGTRAGSGLEAGIEAQTRQTFENLRAVLDKAGMDFSHVVSSSVFLTDSRHFQTMNGIYRSYFSELPPTRATVESDLAIPGALIEISMIAVRPGVEKSSVTPPGWQPPTSPYSWGIQAGNTLFVSGMVSRDVKRMQLITGDIEVQARQVLENVGSVLKTAGFDYADVTSCKVFLSDARDFSRMNEIYRSFFGGSSPPARATVRTRLMNPNLNVEIQCVAVRDRSRRVVVAEGARRSASPFSPSIVAGGRQFLAGMVGRGSSGFAPGDIKAQTRQTLQNLKATLEAEGLAFEDVLESVVFLPDVRHFGAMNEIYREMLPTAPPARTTVGTQLMSPDALVEIMMIAVREP